MNEASAMVAIFFGLLNRFLIFLYKIWTMLVQTMPFLCLQLVVIFVILIFANMVLSLTYST